MQKVPSQVSVQSGSLVVVERRRCSLIGRALQHHQPWNFVRRKARRSRNGGEEESRRKKEKQKSTQRARTWIGIKCLHLVRFKTPEPCAGHPQPIDSSSYRVSRLNSPTANTKWWFIHLTAAVQTFWPMAASKLVRSVSESFFVF